MKKKFIAAILAATVAVQIGSSFPTYAASNSSGGETAVPMYRLYNQNSGEHFYTSNTGEKNYLVKIGWKDEGVGWYAPKSGDPVYRLYNKNGGEHHYTMKATERNSLVRLGWKDEGIGWYSDTQRKVPLYRQYNPYAFANNHNYTSNIKENNYLVSAGWTAEGVAWYGMNIGEIDKVSFPIFAEIGGYNNPPVDFDGDGAADEFHVERVDEEGTFSMKLNDHPAQTFFSARGCIPYYYRYDNDNEFLITVSGQFGGNWVDIWRWENGQFERIHSDVQFEDYARKYPTSAEGKTVYFACSYYHGDYEKNIPLTLNPKTHRFT